MAAARRATVASSMRHATVARSSARSILPAFVVRVELELALEGQGDGGGENLVRGVRRCHIHGSSPARASTFCFIHWKNTWPDVMPVVCDHAAIRVQGRGRRDRPRRPRIWCARRR